MTGSQLVFASPRGGPLTPSNPWRRLQQLAERAGLPRMGMHGFRRGYGSMGQNLTGDVVGVSRSLGHAGIDVTDRHYLTSVDPSAARVARAVQAAFFGISAGEADTRQEADT